MTAAAKAAARFGMPTEWGAYHAGGLHVCVDGRWYQADCLITDPATEQVARAKLARYTNGGDAR